MLTERADPPVPGVPRRSTAGRCTGSSPSWSFEVEFLNWTGDGRLRNPVFRGIRADKSVAEATGDG